MNVDFQGILQLEVIYIIPFGTRCTNVWAKEIYFCVLSSIFTMIENVELLYKKESANLNE